MPRRQPLRKCLLILLNQPVVLLLVGLMVPEQRELVAVVAVGLSLHETRESLALKQIIKSESYLVLLCQGVWKAEFCCSDLEPTRDARFSRSGGHRERCAGHVNRESREAGSPARSFLIRVPGAGRGLFAHVLESSISWWLP